MGNIGNKSMVEVIKEVFNYYTDEEIIRWNDLINKLVQKKKYKKLHNIMFDEFINLYVGIIEKYYKSYLKGASTYDDVEKRIVELFLPESDCFCQEIELLHRIARDKINYYISDDNMFYRYEDALKIIIKKINDEKGVPTEFKHHYVY